MTMLEHVEHRVEEHACILQSAGAIFGQQQRLIVTIASLATSLSAVVPFDEESKDGRSILRALNDLRDLLRVMERSGLVYLYDDEDEDEDEDEKNA